MSGDFLPGGLPRRGCQFTHPSAGPFAELGQNVVEIFAQIDVQSSTGFHDRGDCRHFRSRLFAPNVQPVLATQCQGPDGPFAPVMPPPVLCRVANRAARNYGGFGRLRRGTFGIITSFPRRPVAGLLGGNAWATRCTFQPDPTPFPSVPYRHGDTFEWFRSTHGPTRVRSQ